MEIKVNNHLEVLDYLVLVEAIAKGYFDEETGMYQPHIGKLDAMRLYYNNCITECECTEKYGTEINDVDTFIEMTKNTDFIKEFNKAVMEIDIDNDYSTNFSFSDAFWDAKEIVCYKQSSFGTVIDIIGKLINKFTEKLNPLLTEEKINEISKLINEMADGKLTPDSVITSYMNKLANLEETGNVTNKE